MFLILFLKIFFIFVCIVSITIGRSKNRVVKQFITNRVERNSVGVNGITPIFLNSS